MKWPLSFSDQLKVGNPRAHISIITLWTKKEILLKHITNEFAVVGQLYSADEGLNMLIRNLLANKNVRDIILTGKDISGSGEALVKFFRGDNGNIDEEIPKEKLDTLRDNVTLHDHRNLKIFSDIDAIMESIEKKESYGDPEVFPEKKIVPPLTYPSEQAGFIVRQDFVEEAWINALKLIMKFGTLESDQKMLRGMILTVEKENPNDLKIGHCFDFGKDDVDEYTNILHNKFENVDVYSDLPKIMFTLRKIQNEKEPLIVYICRAYLKKEDWRKSEQIVKHFPLSFKRTGDPRGNLIIRNDRDNIVVIRESPDGKRLEEIRGKTAFELYKKLTQEGAVSEINHAFYIGTELQKAEYAIKNNMMYDQDK